MPRPEIRAVDSRGRLLLMKILRHVAFNRTTKLGLHPVY
jgi:hypothetical protein